MTSIIEMSGTRTLSSLAVARRSELDAPAPYARYLTSLFVRIKALGEKPGGGG
jgi:hypothetical protein